MAGDIITALDQDVDGPPTTGLTVASVLREFMASNVFQEMNHLHDALLTCTISQKQELLPKSCVYYYLQHADVAYLHKRTA